MPEHDTDNDGTRHLLRALIKSGLANTESLRRIERTLLIFEKALTHLDQRSLKIMALNQQVQDALADLTAKVSANTNATKAAEAAITGLKNALDAALASSSDPAEIVAAVKQVSDAIGQNTSELAQSVTDNTPAAT